VSTFTPFNSDSLMWRINKERVVLLGGPAAAVLQAAHPQVAMGVAAHSAFRRDAHGRLRRTLDAVYTVAFGSADEVAMVRDSVGRAHRSVRGSNPAAYSAFDQGAQLWVLATLIMASVTMYRRFVAPLTDTDLDAFLRENAIFGQVFGLQEGALPLVWKDFRAYWRSMIEGDLLGSHPLCGEVARAAVSPDAPWSMRCLSPVFSALALEYVPAPLRRRLGFRADGDGALWRILDRILPTILRSVPARWRLAPAYHRAINPLVAAQSASFLGRRRREGRSRTV
jgi:uncharacterized protein (DUF2236 family)